MAISQSHLKSMVQVAEAALAVLDQTKAQLDNLARSLMQPQAQDPCGQFDPSSLIFLIGQIERSIQDAIPTSLRIAVALESDHIARTEAINIRRRTAGQGATRDPSPTPGAVRGTSAVPAYRTLSGLRKAAKGASPVATPLPDFTPVTSIPAPTPQQLADYAAFNHGAQAHQSQGLGLVPNSKGRPCEAPVPPSCGLGPQSSLSRLYNPAPEIPTNGDADELLM